MATNMKRKKKAEVMSDDGSMTLTSEGTAEPAHHLRSGVCGGRCGLAGLCRPPDRPAHCHGPRLLSVRVHCTAGKADAVLPRVHSGR